MPLVPVFTPTFFDRHALEPQTSPTGIQAQQDPPTEETGTASSSQAAGESASRPASPRGAASLPVSRTRQDEPLIFTAHTPPDMALREFQEFINNGDYARCAKQYGELLDRIITFVETHAHDIHPPLTQGKVDEIKSDFLVLKERVTNTQRDHFSTHKPHIYGPVKALFHQLEQLLGHPRIPLRQRLDAVAALSEKVPMCVAGIVEALNDATTTLQNSSRGIRGAAARFKHQVVKDLVTKHVVSTHGGRYRPGEEVHYGTRFINHLADEMGLRRKQDPMRSLTSSVTHAELERCKHMVLSRLEPSLLAKVMAEDYLAKVQDGHTVPSEGVFSGDQLAELWHRTRLLQQSELDMEFGSVPLDTVLVFNDTLDACRFAQQPTLVAKDLMQNLRADGLVSFDDTVTLSGDDPQTGAIKMLGTLFWRDQEGKCTEMRAEELLALSPTAVLDKLRQDGVPAQEHGTILRHLAQGVLEAVQAGEIQPRHLPQDWLQECAQGLVAQEAGSQAQLMRPLVALAAISNGKEVLQTLQQNGADLHAADDNGMTPVMFAAENGCNETLEVLIYAGADVNARNSAGRTAVLLAAQQGHFYPLILLTSAGADVNDQDGAGYTATMLAAMNNHRNVLLTLNALNADLNQRNVDRHTALMLAAKHGHVDALVGLASLGAQLHAQDDAGNTAVSLAARHGHVEALKYLAQIEADLSGPTWLAAQQGDATALQRLLAAGANPDTADAVGATPAMCAAKGNHVAALKVLVEGGANLDLQDNQRLSAVMYAAFNGHVPALRVLVEGKANLDLRNRDGISAAMFAAYEGHADALEVLAKGGANLDLQDNKGNSAAVYAAIKNHVHALWVLVEGGARLD